MDILKTATNWAKAEVFSSQFFILFGIVFILATIGFWQLGKTDLAKSFVWPTLIAGMLLLAVGLGIYFTNKSRVVSFVSDYEKDDITFVQSEIERTSQSMSEYQLIVFKIIPLMIVIAAFFIIFMDTPMARAVSTTVIGMLIVILFVDNHANARIEIYHKELLSTQEELKK